MKLSEPTHQKQRAPQYSTTSKMLLVVFVTSLLLANVLLLQQTRALSQNFNNEQKQATWFLFQLSKELSELVGEARRVDENVLNIEGAELQYELAWSRFDLLISSNEAYTFFSRNNMHQYFIDLFEEFQGLEAQLVEARTGDSQAAAQFYRSTQTLYLSLVDFVNQNFRLSSKVYEAQKGETQRLMQAQYMLFATFVLSILSLTYFFYRESHFHRKLALSDPLTHLGNRNALFINLNELTQEKRPFSLWVLDLNGFKSVNDTHGHQVGDTVLREIARRLKSMALNDFTVYRMGGDEFAVILEGEHVDEEGVSEHINAVFDAPILNSDNVATLSTSMGLAQYPKDSNNVDFLISIADKRMYKMKFQR
ncbi:GGDEF domain-containing protein [Vibrio antiquarius]|uniref:GGDEF domain-containing protein n=1 Tax=Vibrio diabolicus TaxID=50719 RepID=UPI001112B1E4|nr:GGDEF domain-containing protein [Vibrio diabolicus]TNC13163.1 GGDEF domain-containing protein [Vibrio diabolicus]